MFRQLVLDHGLKPKGAEKTYPSEGGRGGWTWHNHSLAAAIANGSCRRASDLAFAVRIGIPLDSKVMASAQETRCRDGTT
jgi:hypothetical protein